MIDWEAFYRSLTAAFVIDELLIESNTAHPFKLMLTSNRSKKARFFDRAAGRKRAHTPYGTEFWIDRVYPFHHARTPCVADAAAPDFDLHRVGHA